MILTPKHVLISAMLLANFSIAGLAQKKGKAKTHGAHSQVKFIEDIEINPEQAVVRNTKYSTPASKSNTVSDPSEVSAIETLHPLSFKYALLLNAEVETVRNVKLFSLIDDWFGTVYRLGGTDKKGIDCSAFMQVLTMGVFGINLPRTAKEQFNYTSSIDPLDLREGDLVFFSSGGGISHVGFYLQNNKFVHASTSEGVTISDLADTYWARRFAGAGRIIAASATSTLKP